jgi:outer membrane receptor protein involved in Fe transport
MKAICCIVALAISAWAQQTIDTATVQGRVEDPSGATVVAAVTIENARTGVRATAASGANGEFRFNTLRAGDYLLSATADGFAPASRKLTVALGQSFYVSLRMTVAGRSENLTVNDDAPVVETTRTQVSDLVQEREVSSLPLNGRNYLDLALLVPGVSRTNTGSNQRFAETSAVPGTGLSVNGQRNLNNSFIVDGVSANDDAAELAGTFYSQEVVREFQVIRTGGIAEFGRASSGFVSIGTRSGGNDLHGDLYGYLRNQRMDARNPLSTTKLPLTQAQYGVSLGGPIVRNRTFFFSNFEQTRQNTAGVITITPANVAAIKTQLTALNYLGQQITTGSFPATLDSTNFFTRLDHAFTPRDQLNVRYNLYDMSSLNARNVGGLNAVSRAFNLSDRDQNLGANNVWTLSDRTLLESRFQYVHSRFQSPPTDLVGPAVNISGVASFGTATFSPTGRNIDSFELANNVTHQRGTHSFKAGVDYLYDRVRIDLPGALQGVYAFANLANFLAGTYINYQQAFGEPTTHQSNPNVGLFVSDEWRVRPNLTLNAGVRYDLQFLPSLVNTDTNNVSPRVGIAWDPSRDGKTVIRASYGLFFDRLPLRAISNAIQRDGVNYRVAVLNLGQPGAPNFPNVLPAYPTGVLTAITSIDPNIQESYSQQGGLEVERQLGKGASLSVGYNHLRGEKLLMLRNLNVPTNLALPNGGRPDPTIGNNGQFQSIGDAWYDGMTVAYKQHAGNWASVRVSYTYSKALDTAGNFFFSTPQDNFNIAAEKGRSDNDQRHRLAVSGTLTSPTAVAQKLRDHLLHGWQLSYFYQHASALPFNILTGTDTNKDTNNNDRPAGVARNAGHAFGFDSLDLRLERSFRLDDRWRIAAMVDGFNILNHTNFQLPNNVFGTGPHPGTPSNPFFAQPTAAADPRQIQLGLKVTF